MSWGVATQNGVSVSLASIVSLFCGATEFSPASLFTSGVAGAWYDPSDTSTLFQDSAGITPVTAVEQPVGLMLDKSQGLVLGSELVTNPGPYTTTTGWTPAVTTLSAVSGELKAVNNSAGVGRVEQSITTVIGKRYKLSASMRADAANITAASCRLNINTTTALIFYVTANGVQTNVTAYFEATSTSTTLSFQIASAGAAGASGDSIYVTTASVKEIAGNHASQATAASRPILRARYNLLTYSEQFDNAAWTKSALTVTANATTAPYGTSTADKLTEDAANSTHYAAGSATTTAASYAFSCYIKAAERSFVLLWNSTANFGRVFDLAGGTVSGTVAGVNQATADIENVGNGWYRCTIYGTCTAASNSFRAYAMTDATTFTYTGDGTSGIYIWGADLRTGSSAGTYQRIAAATDYATAGFASYLAFDGVDDFLGAAYVQSAYPLTITAGINTDASVSGSVGIVSVAQSDTQYKVLRDMSANGTDANDRNAGNPETADIIVSGSKFALSQFETSLITHQVNGGTATTAANTNAFGTSANIFVGKVRPAGLFSSAKDYGVVITNTVLTAAEKDSLKNWMAGRMGVTL